MSATFFDSTLAVSSSPADRSALARWSGRLATGIAVSFIALDTTVKLVTAKGAVAATVQLGYPSHLVFPIGVIELTCLIVYLIPRTALIGAVLWTGYLGGAVASNVRLDNPVFSHTLFPVYVAALLWGGLCARDARVRALLATR